MKRAYFQEITLKIIMIFFLCECTHDKVHFMTVYNISYIIEILIGLAKIWSVEVLHCDQLKYYNASSTPSILWKNMDMKYWPFHYILQAAFFLVQIWIWTWKHWVTPGVRSQSNFYEYKYGSMGFNLSEKPALVSIFNIHEIHSSFT